MRQPVEIRLARPVRFRRRRVPHTAEELRPFVLAARALELILVASDAGGDALPPVHVELVDARGSERGLTVAGAPAALGVSAPGRRGRGAHFRRGAVGRAELPGEGL